MPAEELDIEALYREHAPFLGRSIERLTGAGSHVDDLLQETFIVAYQKREQFEAQLSSIRTWLYGIAANLCLHHLRSQRRLALFRTRFAENLQDQKLALRPDQQLEQHQAVLVVYELLQKLPFKQREVFSCYELEKMDGGTIAATLGIPEGTVWTRLHHARKGFNRLMRQRMGKEG
jgi:RNA polymerase sigma factor (sigma-70 family)